MLANDTDLATLILSRCTVTSREDREIALLKQASGSMVLDKQDEQALLEVLRG